MFQKTGNLNWNYSSKFYSKWKLNFKKVNLDLFEKLF